MSERLIESPQHFHTRFKRWNSDRPLASWTGSLCPAGDSAISSAEIVERIHDALRSVLGADEYHAHAQPVGGAWIGLTISTAYRTNPIFRVGIIHHAWLPHVVLAKQS